MATFMIALLVAGGGSTLRELEAGARAALTVLLALLLAGVAGQQAAALQRRAVAAVEAFESARDAVAERRRLARRTSARHVGRDVEAARRVGGLEGLMHDHARDLAREVVVEGAAVHGDVAGARPHAHARDGGLAPPGGHGDRLQLSQPRGPPAAARRGDARRRRTP